MASNKEKVYTQYGDGIKEDSRHAWSRSQSLEFHYTKKAMDGYINKDTRVLEIGCATGYYAMHYADKCKEYVGIDLSPPHIRIFTQKIAENKLTNVSCMVGDAVNLEGIEDDSFDVVLCLGPMYHLPHDERNLVFTECVRVCKPGGNVAVAYINKVGVYVGVCVGFGKYSEIYPNEQANEYVLRQSRDDIRSDLFYYTMPEEITAAAAEHGLEKISNTATDFFITQGFIDQMDDATFEIYMELADEMAKYESCTGMSNHALLICRKNEEGED